MSNSMPSANSAWFTFNSKSCPGFSVYAFTGNEEVCKPYEFSIELVHTSANVNIGSLLGSEASLTIQESSGETRHVHGLIAQMDQLDTGHEFTRYRCLLTPRLWLLGAIVDIRIFQNLSAVEIIRKILQEQGFSDSDVQFKLSFEYKPRVYCTQYSETDLHFITRLCEEEGLYFYFEHTANAHTLCFCDREGGAGISGDSKIRFVQGSGNVDASVSISKLTLHDTVTSNKVSYKEWNFERPRLNLEVSDSALGAPAPQVMVLEQYEYPHLYQLQAEGQRYVAIQQMRQQTFSRWIRCESDVARFLPGFCFTVSEHPRLELNDSWWITAVIHQGKQPGVLKHEASDVEVLSYSATAIAIPATTRFIPSLEHPRSSIDSDQTAIVTGPAGEEIYTDKFGRVKVQFHWDRYGRMDENSSCWIRVSQG